MAKLWLTIVQVSLLFCLQCTSAAAYTFALHASEGGTLYLHTHADNQQSESFLIDTGSSLTILNQHTFQRIRKAQSIQSNGYVIAALADGRKQKVKLYTIPVLKLSESCQFSNVSVAVMNNKNNILGMEVLSRANTLDIQLYPPKLTLGNCDLPAESSLAQLSYVQP